MRNRATTTRLIGSLLSGLAASAALGGQELRRAHDVRAQARAEVALEGEAEVDEPDLQGLGLPQRAPEHDVLWLDVTWVALSKAR